MRICLIWEISTARGICVGGRWLWSDFVHFNCRATHAPILLPPQFGKGAVKRSTYVVIGALRSVAFHILQKAGVAHPANGDFYGISVLTQPHQRFRVVQQLLHGVTECEPVSQTIGKHIIKRHIVSVRPLLQRYQCPRPFTTHHGHLYTAFLRFVNSLQLRHQIHGLFQLI